MSAGNATSGEWVGEYPNEKYVFAIKNMYVYVYETSIIDVIDVDAIINATNDKLATGAGVAAVIAQKAGKAMTDECSSYIRDNGALLVTENYVSTAGYLPFNGIIHVVGPTWNNYTSRQMCAKDLFNTVINAFMVARDKGWSKVALPAISSGRSGVPKQLCAEMYMMAFAEFALNGPDGMKEVHFVDMNREMIDLVCQAQEKWYKNPRSLAFENASKYRPPEQRAKTASTGQGAHNDVQAGNLAFADCDRVYQQQRGQMSHDTGRQGQQSTRRLGAFSGFGEDSRYKFKVDNLRVYVYQCSITEITDMDAIANSTINTLEHRCGVALEILKAAGDEMNDQCRDYVRSHGNVKVTRNFVSIPGNLRCNGIVHAVGPHWDNYSGQRSECARDLFQTVVNVLVSVKQNRWRKVAMSAISAEHSGVPKQICAEMYVKAITEFAERGSGSVTEVHFIDIDKNMLDMVVKAHRRWVKNPNSLSFDNANTH